MSPDPSHSRIRVGPYEVLRHLAGGGMGEVYVARDSRSGAEVALKTLRAGASNRSRFLREGRVTARLEHPHIVRVLSVGEDGGVNYLAMELLRGGDLETLLRSGPLDPAEAVRIARQVCDALAHAHDRGVIHRDLKPANIFLCGGLGGAVKVLDFGIAHVLDEERITRTGNVLGTLAYMSPEQARGRADIDGTTDVWSLGVVLFECLAGRRPFVSATAPGLLYQVMTGSAPDLGALCPNLPRTLVEVVARALQNPRQERFSTIRSMSDALAAVEFDPASGRRRALAETVDASLAVAATRCAVEDDSEQRLSAVAYLRDVRDAAFVEGVARELGGHAEVLATGAVVVLFGADRWVGDEPSRAVRLAQATAAVRGAVGVATGRVLRSEASVVGAVIEVAARLADRGGVRVDRATAALVRGVYDLATDVDGSARVEPQRARLRSSTPAPSFDAPCVGREVEVAVLAQSVAAAQSEGRVRGAAVLGVAGIGKSRLRHEAAARVEASVPQATILVARCDASSRDSPFAALHDALSRAFDPRVVSVFRSIPRVGDPVAMLDQARASLLAVVEGLASQGPVVLALDDVQWIDVSSRATVRWLREQALDLPLVVWAFGRPEAAEVARELTGGGVTLELSPLDRGAAAQLVRAISGSAPDAVLDRAAGHPLFLEELGRLLAARGEQSPETAGELPISVESAYLSQLDRLSGAERELLKRASVFGHVFWLDAVERMGADGAAAQGLARAGMILPRARSRHACGGEHVFRNRALQEVAYGLLPTPQRVRLHAHAAEWLAAREAHPQEEVARHWELAGEPARAAEWHVKAAELSARVADVSTACAHAERAIELTVDPLVRWRALVARDEVLQLTDRTELARENLATMSALAAELSVSHRVEAAWRRCYFARVTYDGETARVAGHEALASGGDAIDARWAARVHIDLAMVCATRGEIEAARAYATTARKAAARAADDWIKARAIGTLAYVLGEAGAESESLDLCELAADGFHQTGDRRREALMRANAAWSLLRLGRLEESEAQMVSAIDASKRVGNRVTVASCTHNLGILRRVAGDLERAEALQTEADAMAEARGNKRLAGAVAVERVYLALARGVDAGTVGERVAAASRLAEESKVSAVIASARAVALRASQEGDPREEGDTVRKLALAQEDVDARVELSAAVWAKWGLPEDEAALRAEIEAWGARVEEPEMRFACEAALCRRYLLPEAIFATKGATG